MHPFIPVLSPSFLYHPYIPSFKSKDFSFTCIYIYYMYTSVQCWRYTKGVAEETGSGRRVGRDKVLTALECVDVCVELGPEL